MFRCVFTSHFKVNLCSNNYTRYGFVLKFFVLYYSLKNLQASRLHYSIHERVYVAAIENAYSFASKTLLDLLLNEYDLMRRLQSVKHYLLMDQVIIAICMLYINCRRIHGPLKRA